MNKTYALTMVGLMIAHTIGVMYVGHHAYYYVAHFIDGFSYLPLVEGSTPPVFGKPRTLGGQASGWTAVALITISAFVLNWQMIRKLVRA